MAEAENQKVKTKRELMRERLQGRYPDANLDDDEVLNGLILDDYDKYDSDLKDYQKREQSFADLFGRDPRSASFLTAWRNGSNPVVELVRQFGKDIKEAIDDPERQEEIAAANEEFVQRVAKEKELDDAYQANLANSLAAIEKLQSENGLTDEQVDEAFALLITIIRDGIMGKFTPETIDMAMKALHHDSDVAAAEHEGEVRGKNGKIEEKLRKGKKGDGMPNLDGKNGGQGKQKPRKSLGALDNYGDNNLNIWERGNEKRTPRG